MTATALEPATPRAGSGLRVAIHQPNLLPWLGFFAKAAQADVLVLLDDVPFSRGSYTNRVKVMGRTGPTWLTVPVAHPCSGVPIRSLVAATPDAYERAERQLLALYGPAAREVVFDLFMQTRDCGFVDANAVLIRAVLRQLAMFDVRQTLARASTFRPSPTPGVAGLIELVRAVGGTTYVAGRGAAAYDDPAEWRAAGIEYTIARFTHPVYPQRRPAGMEFVPGLSVVDSLLNVGAVETRRLLREARR